MTAEQHVSLCELLYGSTDCKDHVTLEILCVIFFVVICHLIWCLILNKGFYITILGWYSYCFWSFEICRIIIQICRITLIVADLFNTSPKLLGFTHFKIHECILCRVFKFQHGQPVIWIFPRSWWSGARAWHLWGICEIWTARNLFHIDSSYKGRWRELTV